MVQGRVSRDVHRALHHPTQKLRTVEQTSTFWRHSRTRAGLASDIRPDRGPPADIWEVAWATATSSTVSDTGRAACRPAVFMLKHRVCGADTNLDRFPVGGLSLSRTPSRFVIAL